MNNLDRSVCLVVALASMSAASWMTGQLAEGYPHVPLVGQILFCFFMFTVIFLTALGVLEISLIECLRRRRPKRLEGWTIVFSLNGAFFFGVSLLIAAAISSQTPWKLWAGGIIFTVLGCVGTRLRRIETLGNNDE